MMGVLKHLEVQSVKEKTSTTNPRQVVPTSNLCLFPSKIKWDLTNGPLGKVLALLETDSSLGVHSVGPVGDFLDY